MKHPLRITFLLIVLFLLIQIFGLYTLQRYDSTEVSAETGEIVVVHQDTVFGEQPKVEKKELSFIPIMIIILVGTAIIFLLMRFKLGYFWKYGFMAAVFFSIGITLGVYINAIIAAFLALVFALLKIFKPNMIIHNLTEILIYPGIAIVMIPFFNLFSVIVLLLLISVYDVYAVNKSKHMITLAKFQTSAKAFAGLFVPYEMGSDKAVAKEKQMTSRMSIKSESRKGQVQDDQGRSAILGGGDIAFPLIFSAVVYEDFLMKGYIPTHAFLVASIISITATIALIYLFIHSEKGKYYPAMPFLSAGCLIGYAITLLF